MDKRAVYIHNGKPMHRSEFETWIENQVFSELDKFIKTDDTLAVAVSGGKDSTFLLDMVHTWNELKNRSPISAIIIDEGICGYREFTIKFLKDFCEQKKIKLYFASFEKETGATLDKIIEKRDANKLTNTYGSCTICGAFRRYLLNRTARKVGATKLLVGHNLDDEVQTLLMNLFVGNVGQASRKGELAGVIKHVDFVVRFKPLIWLPEKAIATYALLNYPEIPTHECPYLRESLRQTMRKMTNDLEVQWPGFRQKVMRTYVEKMLPKLGKKIPCGKLLKCEVCSEPASQKICKPCELKQKLNLKL
ncbi:MAG: TIGR00269 family protein [Candidatus Altiarchaeota archaeon]|nr:TIGR00269 family protein [Candidatus Altiarchaeota archaeon]